MVFYYFGPDESSWALGNDRFSMAKNLPQPIKEVWDKLGGPFQDKQMAGTLIQWMSTAPDGRYAIVTKNGACYAKHQGQPLTTVDYVSLSPLGGWLVRYSDGTAQLSGRFPDVFYAIASPYIDANSRARQRCSVRSAFFGAGNGIIVNTDRGVHYENLSQGLTRHIQTITADRFEIGVKTALCPWSIPYLLPINEVSQELMGHVIANVQPPQHLIPRLSSTASSDPSRQSVASSLPTVSRPTEPSPKARRFAEERKTFEEIFDAAAKGSSHLEAGPAADVLRRSGLDDEALCTIWGCVYTSGTGTLDRAQFSWAMRLVFSKLNDTTPDIRPTIGRAVCRNGCRCGLKVGEEIWCCVVCDGGRFDLCTGCYADERKRCKHEMRNVVIELVAEPEKRMAGLAVCDGCSARIEGGTLVYCCEVCDGGNYGICGACWKAQRKCSHVLRRFRLRGVASNFKGHSTRSNTSASQTKDQEPVDEMDKLSKQFGDAKLKESLVSSILSEKPNVKWDDVAGLESAKSELQEAIIFPIRFPQMFRGKCQPKSALLLYGPPGTGKSYLVKAVATKVDHTLFSVSSSDIMSKWMGESEQLMRQLFKLAREKKPSVIFIDEIDAICGNKDGSSAGSEHTARMKTEFLVQMDGVGNNNDGVFVLGATNLPWNLDPAVRRRFQKMIHIPLPDEETRAELFKVHVGAMASTLDSSRLFADLASMTGGFSGSDVANLVQDALMMPVKRVHSATHFRRAGQRGGDADDVESGSWGQLKEPPLSREDLEVAVRKGKASVGEEETRKYVEWTREYGMEGA